MSSYNKCDYCGDSFEPLPHWKPMRFFFSGLFSELDVRSALKFEDTCPRCQKIIIKHIKRLKCAMKRRGKRC